MCEKCSTDKPSAYLTFEQTQVFLNLKKSRLRYAVRHKQIPYIKFQNSILFDRAELIRWIDGMKKSPIETPQQLKKELRRAKRVNP